MNIKKCEAIARKLPPCVSRFGKRFITYKRAKDQLRSCKQGFQQHGEKYPQPILFIAGLPKSGSTWIEKMVSSYEGFNEYLLPAIARHELRTGGSHDFEMPKGMFDSFKDMLVLTKMHSHGSKNNVQILHEAGVNYVVLHRDLRDVAVSYHFYVQNTPWHPEYQFHNNKTVQEGLQIFGDRMLQAYVDWVRSWKENADPNHSIQLRYEDMLKDPFKGMTMVATLFELDNSPETIQGVVEAHSFAKMSGGRKPGEASVNAFARKGVSGDWKNHFTPELREQYGKVIADFLIETTDEQDDSWVTDRNENNT